jgi:hypothetical protein
VRVIWWEFFAHRVLARQRQRPVPMQLAKLVKTALDETRMLVLGAQILLGFEFSGVFRDGFESLPQHARYLDGIALVLMIITVTLLITPETYHHLVDIGVDTGRFIRLISLMAACALLPFALSLGIALFIVGERVFGFSGGLVIGCLVVLVALGGWYGIQYLRRLRTGQKERATTARQQTMTENPPLDQRIDQMLTEARVVLPGVQALLGFQLISTLSESFARLPASSKVIHAASLGCITLAVILLIAPAAYHRIVFSGQDTEELDRVGRWLVTGATVPLALGLTGDLYVVLTEITASPRIGVIIAGIALLLLVGFWHALPATIRLRRLQRSEQ